MWGFVWLAITGPAVIVFFLTKNAITVILPAEKQKLTAPKQEDLKKCPFCAESILKEATFCRYCKNDLTESKAEKEQPKPETNMVKKATALFKNGDYKETTMVLNRHIEKNTQDASAFYLRAVAFSKMKDRNKMLSDLETASKIGHKKATETLAKITK